MFEIELLLVRHRIEMFHRNMLRIFRLIFVISLHSFGCRVSFEIHSFYFNIWPFYFSLGNNYENCTNLSVVRFNQISLINGGLRLKFHFLEIRSFV